VDPTSAGVRQSTAHSVLADAGRKEGDGHRVLERKTIKHEQDLAVRSGLPYAEGTRISLLFVKQEKRFHDHYYVEGREGRSSSGLGIAGQERTRGQQLRCQGWEEEPGPFFRKTTCIFLR